LRLRLSSGAHLLLVGLLLGVVASGGARAQPVAATPEGSWLTQDHDGVIAITACNPGICGRIVGMIAPRNPNGSVPRDPAGHPVCGLAILRAEPTSPGTWDGRIVDPNDGTSWTCRLTLAADGTLHLRGYVLLPLLGRTQVWTHYAGTPAADCAMS